MRAVRLHEAGGPERVRVETLPDPVPGPRQILVRVARAALNRRDLYITQGRYPHIVLPCVLGSDGAGTVEALGPGVAGPAPGTTVVINPQLRWSDDPAELQAFGGGEILGMPTDGTFAELIVVPAENVYPAPRGLTMDEAAAIPLAGLTAYRAAFTRGGLTAKDIVLLPGIGSGVQSFALLYAKHVGARTIVTSRGAGKLERARSMGADVVIDATATPDWRRAVREAAGGRGPSLVIDSVGGETLTQAIDVAAPSARIVVYGGTTGDATLHPASLFWKQLNILGTSMGSPAEFAAMLALFEGGLRPVVDRVYPLEQAADALFRLEESEQFGKVVLAVR